MQWQHALALCRARRDPKLEPNVISCSAGAGAGEKNMQWQHALAVSRARRDPKLEPKVIRGSAGTGACEKGMQLLGPKGGRTRGGRGLRRA